MDIPEEISQFNETGFLIVRGLADERTRNAMLQAAHEGLEREIEPIEFEADLHYPGAPPSRDAAGGQTVRRLKQAHARGFVFTEWLMRPGLTRRLRGFLGAEAVIPLAHHNCIMTKHPRYSSDTGWHQDIRYWSFARPELISLWLALGLESEANGCLWVIPGSHRLTLDRRRFDDELFFRPDLPENQELIARKVKAELDPGDVLFFHAKTLHAATRNHSTQTKISVVFTARPADNPPVPGSRSASLPELVLAHS